MKRIVVFSMCWCVFLSVMAVDELVTVTNITRSLMLNYNLTNYIVTADTVHQTEYPEDIGEPIFWFDCRRTDKWTFAADGSVAKIPSLVGERYLATDTEGGIHKIGWTSKNPLFVQNDESIGGPALDFGTKGSQRAMSFNKVGPDGTQTNMLEGIGTVIAVWYSAMGDNEFGEGGYYGGALLGGGFGNDGKSSWDKSQYLLYREYKNSRIPDDVNDPGRKRWYDTAFVGDAGNQHMALRSGAIFHGSQPTQPLKIGFSGGWEVVALDPYVDNGLPNATGLGMNDSRVKDVSGGFKVAEYIVYGRKLSRSELELVRGYLNWKWFKKRAERGVNGNASIGYMRTFDNSAGNKAAPIQEIDIPEGEKLTIGRYQGGRGVGEASVLKTGDGTLEFGEADKFCGSIKMKGGSLSFSRRSVPSTLPRDAFLHFDASHADSLVQNEAGEVSVWRNLGVGVYRRGTICARPVDAGNAPKVILNALGEGLHVVDFGDFKPNNTCYLMMVTNESEEVSNNIKAGPDALMTVVALVGAQRGGGVLLGSANKGVFARYSNAPYRWDSYILNGGYSYPADNAVSLPVDAQGNASVYIDGIPADGVNAGFYTPGYQVIAMQTPGGGEINFMGMANTIAGGGRIGEIAAWRRPLSEEELLDASAYLMRKWLGREAPGYARFKDVDTPDLQKVQILDDVEVRVNEGSARIGTLELQGAKITKTGDGTLEIQSASGLVADIKGGKISHLRPSDVASESELAQNPSLHLDVSDLSSMEIQEVNGEKRVLFWYSHDKGVLASIPWYWANSAASYAADKYSPYLNESVKLNGIATLDFGPYTAAAGGRAMTLSRSFDSVRSAFVVWASRDDSRGVPLGCGYGNMDGVNNSNMYDFLRKSDHPAKLLDVDNNTSSRVANGDIYTNGVKTTASAVPQAGVFTLTEFHPIAGVHVSALGADRDAGHLSGGIRMAEVVLYERVLSEREIVATRNYLMKKWFNAEPVPLPEAVNTKITYKTFEAGINGSVDVENEVEVEKLIGDDVVLSKEGDGILSVFDVLGYSGSLLVKDGTLRLTGRYADSEGELAAPEDRIYHADATFGLSTVTNDDGVVEVTQWKSKHNDDWAAIPFYDNYRPTLIKAEDLGGAYVVDMGKKGDKQAMLFTKNGVTNLLDGIGSVFWVVGSHNGGGYLLGGGHNYNNWSGGLFNFMRGGSGGRCDKAEYPILSTGWVCPWNLQQAQWRKDGVEVIPTQESLSGGWDLLSMNIVDNTRPTTNADGFAFDGETLAKGNKLDYMGCQRLAEVIIYKRKLTDDERLNVENYLRVKWGIKGTAKELTNNLSVVLADSATLDLGGERQYVKSLAGLGTVQNGTVAVGELVVDASSDVRMTFAENATLEIYPGMRILLNNLEEAAAGDVVELAECAISERENLRSCVVEVDGIDPDKIRPRLRYRDGVLSVNLVPAPSFIIVR